MADSKSLQQELIQQRSRALATLVLTARSDLVVQDVSDQDIGLDFLVVCRGEKRSGFRQLGVAVRGTLSPMSVGSANAQARPIFVPHLRRYGPFPFPACLFFFAMEGHQAWSAWMAEPVLAPGAPPRLETPGDPDCRPLDEPALDAIVAQVHRWYDAKYSNSNPATPGRR